jgi:hypothetical protein
MPKKGIQLYNYLYLVLLIVITLALGIHFGSSLVVKEGLEVNLTVPMPSALNKVVNKTTRAAKKAVSGDGDTFVGNMVYNTLGAVNDTLSGIGLNVPGITL